jgi:molybdopterin/thiamine biosynthesis adenylyltransferase
LGVLPGVIGTIMATEALKLLLGIGTPLMGRLLNYSALDCAFFDLQVCADPNCANCGQSKTTLARMAS